MASNSDLSTQTKFLPRNKNFDGLHNIGSPLHQDRQTAHARVDLIDSLFWRQADLTTIVASLAKEFKGSFSNGMANICENYVACRLKSKLRSIAKSGKKENGHYPVLLSKFGESLNGFEFNSKKPYHDIFKGKYFIREGSNRGHLILNLPSFVPTKSLNTPKEATHFKLYNELVMLSDYKYDAEMGYVPMSKKFHGKKSEFCSSMLPIIKIPTQPITSQLSVNNGMGISNDSGLLLIMGVHFYQYQNRRYKPLPKESSLDIVKVY